MKQYIMEGFGRVYYRVKINAESEDEAYNLFYKGPAVTKEMKPTDVELEEWRAEDSYEIDEMGMPVDPEKFAEIKGEE